MSPLSGEYTSPVRWSDVSVRVRNNRELGWRRHIMRTIDMIELALLIIQVTLFVLRHLWWVIGSTRSPDKRPGACRLWKKWVIFCQTIDKRSQLIIISSSEHCALINNSPEVPPICHRGHFYFTPLWTCSWIPSNLWVALSKERKHISEKSGHIFIDYETNIGIHYAAFHGFMWWGNNGHASFFSKGSCAPLYPGRSFRFAA
jgi:hypothetical protein